MSEEVLLFDQSRPAFPPKHFEKVLEHVSNHNHFMDLGMETGQTFFQLYHQFSGDLVGVDVDPSRVQFALAKAQRLLPTQAVNRTKLIAGDDLVTAAQNSKNKYDLVTFGGSAEAFGSADELLSFTKQQLVHPDGTVVISCVRPETIEFEKCYEDKENIALQKEFETFKEKLSEYTDLTNNPIYNTGVQMRHFSKIEQIQEVAVNLMDAEQLVYYLKTMPSYVKYANDRSQIDKYALQTFTRNLNANIAQRQNTMTNKSASSLVRVSHKILTFLLRK